LVGGVLLGVAVACVVKPFAPQSSPISPVAPAPASDQVALSQVDSGAPSQSNVTAGPTASPLTTTQRQWDTNVPGIVNDPVLASRLDQALIGVDGHVGVAVQDLGSGRGAVLDGDLELQSASLYKLPVLYTVYDLGLSMSEPLTITDEALSYDSGTMELGAGETLTVAEALERMVTLSDNTSAIMLGSRVGAGNIDASISTLGMDTTHYSAERMTTSAVDMLHFVELVARGQAVSRSASADMLHLMLRQRVNDRLPRLLSDNFQVAHKTGNLPGVVNDVGILYGPRTTVAVAVLVSDTSDETAAATAIAQIGLAATSYFEQQPEIGDRPLLPPAPNRPVPPVWREPRPVPPTPTSEPVAPAETRLSPTDVPATVMPAPVATATAVSTATPRPAPTQAPTLAPTVRPTSPPAPTATRVPPPATATVPPTLPPTRVPTPAATPVRTVAPTLAPNRR
jgi:beta-lactamase class A